MMGERWGLQFLYGKTKNKPVVESQGVNDGGKDEGQSGGGAGAHQRNDEVDAGNGQGQPYRHHHQHEPQHHGYLHIINIIYTKQCL